VDGVLKVVSVVMFVTDCCRIICTHMAPL
jgi:hypothetical protein